MSLPLATWSQLYLFPLLVTLALWGGLTLGMLWLNRRGPGPGRLVVVLLVPFLLLAHHQLWQASTSLTIWNCYQAFLAGMFIWMWHELAFYSGILTGPWRAPCPPDARGWRRFGYAAGTHLYHEAGVVVEVILLWWIHHDAVNWVGPLTFVLSWALQHSAKLNVLLGVRNLQVNLFPEHLRYLGSYWTRRPHNPFFVASVVATTLLAAALWLGAAGMAPTESAVGYTLLATLVTLGVLEHWLLVLPPTLSRQPAPINPSTKASPRQWETDP